MTGPPGYLRVVARRPAPAEQAALEALGLCAGEDVRWHAGAHDRWQHGTVTGIGTDGSISVADAGGSARSLRAVRLQVRRPGRPGRPAAAGGWEPLTVRAGRAVQLSLFDRAGGGA